jgi:hypothetical protein
MDSTHVATEAAVSIGGCLLAGVTFAACGLTLSRVPVQSRGGVASLSVVTVNACTFFMWVVYCVDAFAVGHLDLWVPVYAEQVHGTTAYAECCATADCTCAAQTLADAHHNCTALVAGPCVDLGHCCEFDLASCDCGGAAPGDYAKCSCSRCAQFRQCEVTCPVCARGIIELQFALMGTPVHVNFTHECTREETGPDASTCLDQLAHQWSSGFYWHMYGTPTLVASASLSASNVGFIVVSSLLLTGTAVQCTVCAATLYAKDRARARDRARAAIASVPAAAPQSQTQQAVREVELAVLPPGEPPPQPEQEGSG